MALEGSDVKDAIALLSAGLVILMAATIERFELLKGLGLEAKTRAIDRKLDEADLLLGQVRRLSVLTSANLIKQAAKAGRWDSALTTQEMHEYVSDARSQLQSVQASDAAIRAALQPWVDTLQWDWALKTLEPWQHGVHAVAGQMLGEASRLSDPQAAAALRTQAQELQQRSAKSAGVLFHAPRDSLLAGISALLESVPAVDPQVVSGVRQRIEEWRDELMHLVQHQELKTPQRWYQYLAR